MQKPGDKRTKTAKEQEENTPICDVYLHSFPNFCIYACVTFLTSEFLSTPRNLNRGTYKLIFFRL